MSLASRCRSFLVNAFTREVDGGNPAGAVLEADELSDAQMRAIADGMARTYGAPDTAFVFRPRGPDHQAHLRFLTPRREATFIGHATLAAQYVRAKVGGERRVHQRQLTGQGLMDIELQSDGKDFRVAITQPAPKLGPLFPRRHQAAVLAALGLSSAALDPRAPLQLVAEKAPRLLIGVRERAALEALKPDFTALKRLSPEVGAEGYFVFAAEPQAGADADTGAEIDANTGVETKMAQARAAVSASRPAGPEPESTAGLVSQPAPPALITHARLFCPVMGIPEDPVSGNTHAMLGVYLLTHGLAPVQKERLRFRGHQGTALGRPGVIDVEVNTSAGHARTVRIEGEAVIVRECRVAIHTLCLIK